MPDGRWLSAEIAGPEDGDLLVLHVGTPGSCYLFEGHVRECVGRGLRIVSASRPGYDGSPRLRGRSYARNPADTRALLDFLGVERAYVMGHSGGGGPALADAALNSDQVRSVAVVSTFAPRRAMGSTWREDLEANEPELTALEEGESRLRKKLVRDIEGMAHAKTAEDITFNPDFPEIFSPVDRACFEGEFLDYYLECSRRIQKGVDGWLDDDFALYEDWGFDLDSIHVPVSIWRGGKDNLIPTAHTEWLARHVPGAQLKSLDDEGHISLFTRHYNEILKDLIDLG